MNLKVQVTNSYYENYEINDHCLPPEVGTVIDNFFKADEKFSALSWFKIDGNISVISTMKI